MLKRIVALICCIVFMFSFTACKKEEPAKPGVATLDGENIDEAYFKYYFTELKNTVQRQYGEDTWQNATFDGKPALEFVRERALDNAVKDKIIMDKAKADGITLTDEDKQNIEQKKQEWINQFGSEKAFRDAINSTYGLSEEQFNYMLEAVYYRNHLIKKYVTDTEALEYYNDNIAKVKHILIPTVELESNIPLTSEQLENAEEKVSLVLSEISKGKDFDSLVSEYTEDRDDYYYVGEGYSLNIDGSMGGGMVTEFETAAFSLDVGEISGVVESPYGYHIIKRYENDEAMYNIAKDTFASVLFTDVMEEWKNQKNLVINESVYNSYN